MELEYKDKKTIEAIKDIIANKQSKYKKINLPNTNKGFFLFGDNFDIMTSLLDSYKEKIDLIYIDPPFNTSGVFFYNEDGSPTISRSEKDIIAYTDNMPFFKYIEFIRERLFLIHQLLSKNGTLYLHIDIKVGHYIKIILDEIFGKNNFVNEITRIKSNPKNFKRRAFGNEKDVIYIYSKKTKSNIFNDITMPLSSDEVIKLFPNIDTNNRKFTTVPCHAPGETKKGDTGTPWKGLFPPKGRHWRFSPKELDILDKKGLIVWSENGNPRIKKYADEHKGKKIQDVWLNFKDPQKPIYPTEKNKKMLDLIIKQSSNPNSIIMDCFCGSGAFLKAGILNNRFVIGIDTSKSSLMAIKKSKELKELKIIESPLY